MKKMFFTATAFVAISATSMANTVEVKEVVIPTEGEKEVVVKRTACDNFWIAAYELYLSQHNGNPGLNENGSAGITFADNLTGIVGC